MAEHDDDQSTDDLPGLRKAAKDGKAALSENERLRKELMFAKAGIDTESRIGGMLFKTWEGDDLDALKVEAKELGLVKDEQSQQQSGQQQRNDDDDADEHARMRRDFRNGQPAGGADTSTPDPTDRALREFQDDVKKGVRRQDAGLAAIDKVISAAASGDKRAIFNQQQWDEQARLASAHRA